MERASPPVSPTVVAQILITQNMRVTAGTLLSRSPLRCSSDRQFTGIELSRRPRPPNMCLPRPPVMEVTLHALSTRGLDRRPVPHEPHQLVPAVLVGSPDRSM